MNWPDVDPLSKDEDLRITYPIAPSQTLINLLEDFEDDELVNFVVYGVRESGEREEVHRNGPHTVASMRGRSFKLGGDPKGYRRYEFLVELVGTT